MAPHTFFLARSPEAPNTAGMLVHRFQPSYVPRIVVSFESTCWRSLDMYGGVDWCDPIFFCGGLTQKSHIGSLLAHACATSADEPTRRQIGSSSFGRHAASAPVGRTCTCGADRRIRHSPDCACVQASPAGLSELCRAPCCPDSLDLELN